MTTRNFDALFAPRRVVLIGASLRRGSVGRAVAENLLAGGFEGEVGLVDPKGGEINGHPIVRQLGDLGWTPDLAVLATPGGTAPEIVLELAERGCRAAVVLSAGFEGDAAGPLRQALLDAARPNGLRVVGPNCLGLISAAHGLNASFARGMPPRGGVALVAQSGAVAAAALDAAPDRGLGFSHIVALGDSLDADAADMLDYLGRDTDTKVILLYVESLSAGRKFMGAARVAARAKPIVVLKGGRSAAGAAAAFSHTRALAGADAVYSAAFRRAGLVQVDSLEALLGAGQLFAHGRPETVGAAAILTNGGGAGVLAADALERVGGRLATLSAETRERLSAALPSSAAVGNPVDVLGDADSDRYGHALATLMSAPEVSAVLVLNCPTAVADSTAAADAVIAGWRDGGRRKPLLAAWLGGDGVAEGRARLAAAGIPSFNSPEAAAAAYGQLLDVQARAAELAAAPGSAEPAGAPGVRQIVHDALAQGRKALTPAEVDAVLAAYGIPRATIRQAPSVHAAVAVATDLGFPVVLKIQSPDLTHKSDVGGVAIGLGSAAAVRRAATQMRSRLRALRPEARLNGFVVQPLVDRSAGQEILCGLVRDPVFGPVVVVGQGGVAVEAIADRALALPPLDRSMARDLVARTRVARLLAGYRDRPAADLDALADILVALGQLALDVPEVAELDLNPVLCDAAGAVSIDARIAVAIPQAGAGRPAVLPYPAHLVRRVVLDDEPLTIRPIRPRDADGLMAMVDACTTRDVHLRFCGGMRHLDRSLAARHAQIDYDRHMALVAETDAGAIVGVGRLVEDPEGETAEFALMVRSDHQRRGLGHLLLRAILDHADARGLREVWGDVAAENGRMLEVSRDLGFQVEGEPDEVARVRVARRRPGP